MFIFAVAATQNALWALCLAIGAGCLLTVLSRRLHLPTIVLLLFGGFIFGPEGIDLLRSSDLGDFLPMIVSLAVGIILFEGGLTLNLKNFSQTSTVIRRLLTIGVLITWLGSAITAYVAFDISLSFALLMGSLIIVTGPTVIVPLLRRIRIDQKIGGILHWEAVLIDSIGVFIAILCFEWVVEDGGTVALPNFLIRIISGASIGFTGGYIIYWIMKRSWVPDDIINAFTLASAIFIFGVTELVKPEAGLLSVTVAGLIVGLKKPRQLKVIKAFKAEIVDLLIGLLFLLLVSRLEIQQFVDFFEAGGGWVLFSVILIIRPLSIIISSWGTLLNIREKALLSWIAPRGVVAASMASLFALSLQSKGNAEESALMESFVYSIICATVLIQGLSAGIVAKILRLQRPAPNDLIIIGAHYFGRELAAKLMRENEQAVILLDTNADNIAIAKKKGLTAVQCNGLEAEQLYEEQQELFGAGQVLALTDNIELNQLLMLKWADVLGRENVFGWMPSNHPTKKGQLIGQPVFGNLPRPAIVCNKLAEEKNHIESIILEKSVQLPSNNWQPLYIRRGKQLLKPITPDDNFEEVAKKGDEIICLQRAEGFLLRALKNGGFRKIECSNIKELYQQLSTIAVEAINANTEKETVKDQDMQNKIILTYLGYGIAIPNIYSSELKHRICYILSLSKSLEIPDREETVDYIFFILSPMSDTSGHLAMLADISKSCRMESSRKSLKKAETIEDIIATINS